MYGYGTVAVFVISLCAVLGLVLAGARNTSWYRYLLAVMLGMGAGTLAADALLHLIPHVSRSINQSLDLSLLLLSHFRTHCGDHNSQYTFRKMPQFSLMGHFGNIECRH